MGKKKVLSGPDAMGEVRTVSKDVEDDRLGGHIGKVTVWAPDDGVVTSQFGPNPAATLWLAGKLCAVRTLRAHVSGLLRSRGACDASSSVPFHDILA